MPRACIMLFVNCTGKAPKARPGSRAGAATILCGKYRSRYDRDWSVGTAWRLRTTRKQSRTPEPARTRRVPANFLSSGQLPRAEGDKVMDPIQRRTFLAGAAAVATVAAHKQAAADILPLGPLPETRYPDPRVEAVDKRFKYKQGNAY